MRLIDADALIKAIEQSKNHNPHKDLPSKWNRNSGHLHFMKMVSDQPTAFDKEKVIDHITNLANAEVDMSDDEEELVDVEDWFDEGRSQGRFEAYRNSLEIVKKGGIE